MTTPTMRAGGTLSVVTVKRWNGTGGVGRFFSDRSRGWLSIPTSSHAMSPPLIMHCGIRGTVEAISPIAHVWLSRRLTPLMSDACALHAPRAPQPDQRPTNHERDEDEHHQIQARADRAVLVHDDAFD